jgi:hypothetical protein
MIIKIKWLATASLYCTSLFATNVVYINQDTICKDIYIENAILRKDKLFIDDFLTIHALIKIVNPTSIFEIGTCTGEGTLIIKNAIGTGTVYSLELPADQSSYDLKNITNVCHLSYKQLIGNSMTIKYSDYYPLKSWFIDGAHDYVHVHYETQQALQSKPDIIIWHDADIPEVMLAIQDGLEQDPLYQLFRVKNTRIAFSVPSSSTLLGVIYE